LEAKVKAKSSTYDRVVHRGAWMYREAMYMTYSRVEMGEPWGTPTEMGVRVLCEPLNNRAHWRFCKKDTVQAVRYLRVLQERRRFLRIRIFTLSNLPLMSRKRVNTVYSAAWSVCMSLSKKVMASAAEIPARESH
jgi:hypothetical protein